MDELFVFLNNIEENYIRTIFNFHIINTNKTFDIYNSIKTIIERESIFDNVILSHDIKDYIKKIVFCDINLTKHIINTTTYPIYNNNVRNCKYLQFFDIHTNNDEMSIRTTEIFKRDRSSLVSYVRTTNKKKKVDYGEIKKQLIVHIKIDLYISQEKKSDDYLFTTVEHTETRPWIKTISKHMRIDILHDSIITKGKSSILQTIEIVFVNRTCIKIFKDSTMHVILSKDKNEKDCTETINKLFNVYKIIFRILYDITNHEPFKKILDVSDIIIKSTNFIDKINNIKKNSDVYGIYNFKIGMFNLTYRKPIDFTLFPSILDNSGKIKFFKGKKLNIVALKSLDECKRNVVLSDSIMENMHHRSDILNSLNIETASIEKLKELLI
ncbi:viral intermediate transcription factor VITF-3 [Cotia virus SPAn232]|uniref:Intermediate transcription factor 3 large subunit n=2 Tax=Cotia virus TaxID=39444 RepID=H6TAA2_9POXV|nr:viral intermediate transcription factor VITF-3 [Cotia virus SPAn232]ADT91142.1 viral intermediate transcription factor VITF-3 [Cotia virus SPAn232]AIT70747.1 viral intermediate transcription factor VITF-3 [Cotia virus]